MFERLLKKMGYVKEEKVSKKESRLNTRVRFLEKENQTLLLKNIQLEYQVNKLQEERELYVSKLKRIEKKNEDAIGIMIAQEKSFKKFFLNKEA